MTDTVADIVVTGQKRYDNSGGPFPFPPSTPDPVPPGTHDMVPPDIDNGFHPCDAPETREQWNKDAAIAAAAKEFDRQARLAGENGLNDRERAAFLLRDSNGNYSIGPIALGSFFAPAGSSQQPSTSLDPNLVADKSQIVGVIHNHNEGQHQPSDPTGLGGGDEGGLQTVQNIMNTYNQGSGAKAMMYIVASTSGANAYNKISAYSVNTIKYDANGNPPPVGPEVNPDGQACPI